MKRKHRYRITIEHLDVPKADMTPHKPLSFEASNHDDLFSIIERSKQKGIFDEDTAASLALGSKLFGEVMMNGGYQPLFERIRDPFRAFIRSYKSLGTEQ